MKEILNIILKRLDKKEMIEKSNKTSIEDNSAEECYSTIKEEYIHSFNRSDKLDNKVYIAFTVCGFLFLFIMDFVNSIKEIDVPRIMDYRFLIFFSLYLLLCMVTIILFLYVIIKLASLLTPMNTKRINTDYLMENNLQKLDKYTFNTFISIKYCDAINSNSKELERRFKQYKKCVQAIIGIVICSFILEFIKLFL